MKNVIKALVFLALPTLVITSCEKENDSEKKDSQDNDSLVSSIIDTSITLNASSKSVWKYYSFDKGDTISISDPSNSLLWDIAFQRYMVKTNGGKSGKGLAASFATNLKSQSGFDALKIVPDTAVFSTDDTVKVYGYNPANPSVPTVISYILNAPLYNWYTLQQGTQSTLVPNNYIYVVKTAAGKHVKLWIQSYYKDEDASAGYIKIKYVYQKDGSKNFK